MPADMNELADDLAAETVSLRELVAGLDEAGWRRATPAPGWSIADQISHLAHFDEAAVASAVRPVEFRAELARAMAPDASGEDAAAIDPDKLAERYRTMPPADLLVWFDTARAELLATFRGLHHSVRVPWFGMHMSAASSLTARLMETWAHGQDIADTLGVRREPTGRLRHVAHIGVATRAFSFAAHGLPVPVEKVRVELLSPGLDMWLWGPPEAADRVTGSALDFCLAVTQRRHLDDTSLVVAGPVATQWMSIAQAFAGPPGAGRQPGQFARKGPRP
ncbi:MAG TPA: TIGR03084 family metal-binding protein [Streptosporangiaceae bacterium]|nr:TIGR03084 family metal-binding protein [Streptosporangiaceae bacterium]